MVDTYPSSRGTDPSLPVTAAAASVPGQAVAGRTDAVKAAGSVDALMDAETAGLTQRKKTALVDI